MQHPPTLAPSGLYTAMYGSKPEEHQHQMDNNFLQWLWITLLFAVILMVPLQVESRFPWPTGPKSRSIIRAFLVQKRSWALLTITHLFFSHRELVPRLTLLKLKWMLLIQTDFVGQPFQPYIQNANMGSKCLCVLWQARHQQQCSTCTLLEGRTRQGIQGDPKREVLHLHRLLPARWRGWYHNPWFCRHNRLHHRACRHDEGYSHSQSWQHL